MSDEANARQVPAPTGDKWGDPIDEIRKQELWARLRAWWGEVDHNEIKGPFAGERLTGAEVFWLAVGVLVEVNEDIPDVAADRLREWQEDYWRLGELFYLPQLCLCGANLIGAQLKGASLGGVQMNGASLREAQLEGVSLIEAQLERADLRFAHLEGADLSNANLKQADLRRATLNQKTDLTATILTDVRLDGVIFDNTNLSVVEWVLVPRLQDELRPRSDDYGFEAPTLRLHRHHTQHAIHKSKYQAAVRAYRRLAVALQANGMNEEAAGYAYRAQVMQRRVLRSSGWRALGRYLFSGFLDGLAGYGYAPERTLLWYLVVIGGFAGAYFAATHGVLTFGLAPSQVQPLRWYEALILSISAFHGRGFFQPVQSLGDPVAILAAIEAIIGLLIEISFIATFTQRFFGSK